MKTNYVGQLIKARLKALSKTQLWLAEQADVSANAVSKWIATGKIARERIMDVARILECGPVELLSGEGVSAARTSASLATPVKLSLVYVTAEELILLTNFREANDIGRSIILAASSGAPRADNVETAHLP